MNDLPVWVLPLAAFAGGVVVTAGASFARRTARRLHDDGRDDNEWLADLLDSIADGADKGQPVDVTAHVDRVRAKAAELRR